MGMGYISDLNRAIHVLESCLLRGSSVRVELLEALGICSVMRWEQTSSPSDFERAVSAAKEAAGETPLESVDRWNRLNTLGSIPGTRFALTKGDKDIEDAISAVYRSLSGRSRRPYAIDDSR